MPKAVVAYSNDLKQISLGTLNEQEQNLLFSLLVRLKDKGHAPVVFSNTDLAKMVVKNYTAKELTKLVLSLRDHFFKLDFT
ncbi:MAG: RepB family plasmid replication initiator protein [Succinivibrio sp.]|nr:RepB family plasmid replication initiator protein [Succinivibrio sp.]